MAMITYAGWRLGSMTLIVVALFLLPLIFLFMRDDPAEVGLEPYGADQPAAATAGAASLRGMPAKNATITAREVVSHPTFWLLAGSFFVCGGTANGLIGTHLIPHEIEIGIPQIAAASLLGIMGGLNMVGTIFSGWMIDRVQPQRWLALVYALRGFRILPVWYFSRSFTVSIGSRLCRRRWRSRPIPSANKMSARFTVGSSCRTRSARRLWRRQQARFAPGWVITSSHFSRVA
jgi:sugar phosphate permease